MKPPMPNFDSFKAVLRPENVSRSGLSLCEGIALKRGRIHEVQGLSPESLALCVIAKSKGGAIWIGRHEDVRSLSPLALSRYFDPSHLTLVECMIRKDILWAAEQTLRSGGFKSVIFQMHQGPSLHESRRLQLAAETGGSIGIALIARGAQSSACQTRWECSPLAKNDSDICHPLWRWTQTKNKGGNLSSWIVQWKEDGHATGYVDMVSRAAA